MARRVLAATACLALGPRGASSCSRILFNREGFPVLSARSMDWSFDFHDYLFVVPRGARMDGALGGGGRSATWTARYGSVVSSISGWLGAMESSFTGEPFDFERDGGTDGLNERGLAVHMLYLEATRYPGPGAQRGVTYLRWARYLLDTCATVAEAVAAMEGVRVAGVRIVDPARGAAVALGAHVAVEDASGDSAVFELINGSLRTYHGRSANYTVMTNDPPLPAQLANLRRFSPFGGGLPLPGDVTSEERFVRLSYFLRFVPRAQDTLAMAGNLRSIVMSASVPQGAPDSDDPARGVYPTWWVSVVDFRRRLYYFGETMRPNVLWVDLGRLAAEGRLDAGSPTLALNPRRLTRAGAPLEGDVSDAFSRGAAAAPARLAAAAAPSPLAAVGLAAAALLGVAAACALPRGHLPARSGVAGRERLLRV